MAKKKPKKNKITRKLKFGGSIDPASDRALLEYERSLDSLGVIPSPTQTLQENNLRLDRADAKSNTALTAGLEALGSLAVQVGGSFATGKMDMPNFNKKVKAAYGGTFGQAVEVEGEEVAGLPGGDTIEFQGPGHENGGIDVVLPEGTDVFSKRIKIDNITLADRKKKRAKEITKAQKRLQVDPTDKIARNTLDRLTSVHRAEEGFDMGLQSMVSQTQNPDKFAYGGKVLMNPLLPPEENYDDILTGIVAEEEVLPKLSAKGAEKPLKDKSQGGEQGKGFVDFLTNLNSKVGKVTNSAGTATVGDMAGMAGNLYQAFKPRQLTRQNRAGDNPNINPYEDFGKDGLETLNSAKQNVVKATNEARRQIRLNTNAAMSSNRNSASGINTARALDLAAIMAANNADSGIEANEAAQLNNVLAAIAQAQTTRDEAVMGGEANRDTADRQDRDNYYTQLSRDEVGVGQGLAQTGKAVNQIKERGVNEALINSGNTYINVSLKNGTISVKSEVFSTKDPIAKDTAIREFEKAGGVAEAKIDPVIWDGLTRDEKITAMKKFKK